MFGVGMKSFAKEYYLRENALNFEVVHGDDEEPPIMLFSNRIQPIEEYLAEQFANHIEKVYVVQYDITLNEISVILSEHYEYMVVSGSFGFKIKEGSENEINPYIEYILPRYIFSSPDEDEAGRKFIETSVREYADYARSKTDDTVEQLLLIHDRILKNAKYDFKYDTLSFSAYGLFKNNTCVCQGYAEAIYLISKELGVDAGFCSYLFRYSEQKFKGHIWNYIRIGEQWYHLDATWDDPDSDPDYAGIYNSSLHSYFLVSDEKMEDHETENEWIITLDEKPVCDNKKYETNHIFNFKQLSNITYENGDFFATLDVQEPYNSIVFKSCDGLYTGPIITSEVSQTNSDYIVYYYFLENIDKFDVFVGAKDGEKLLSYGHTPKGSYPQFSMSGERISKTTFPQKQGLSMFVWDLDTLRPLSKKVELN